MVGNSSFQGEITSNFLHCPFFFFSLLAMLYGIWGLSSLTRD